MNIDLNMEKVLGIDRSNMFEVLKKFPNQIEDASNIGHSFLGFQEDIESKKFLVLGMGGSAIGGDLLKSFLSPFDGFDIEIQTIRGYNIPKYFNSNVNVIASSYSGGTEETISSFKEAISRKMNSVCITTGGKIKEIADEYDVPVISIPEGYQPRCAVGYSFIPMLYVILHSGLLNDTIIKRIEHEIYESIELLKEKSEQYSKLDENNPALALARKIKGSIPVVYSSYEIMDSVNTRWVRQIQENAKHLAYSGFLPEMNHNEVNSFFNPQDFVNNISLIMLRDELEHERIKIRFDALKVLLEKEVKNVIEVRSNTKTLLARIFDNLYLGDWVSYYLAILNDTDPTPIPKISKLKEILINS